MRHPRIGRAVLAVLAAAAGLVAGELLVRVVSPQIFDVHPPGMYVEDAELGYALAPGFEGEIRRSEYRVRVSVGASGLRGGDARPRRAGTYRVLVLGDSQAFGFGVADEETFSARLEALVEMRFPGLDVRVLNGAVPGYGTADQLAFLDARGPKLEPDLVVVQFLSVNDLQESRAPAHRWAAVRGGYLTSRVAGPEATPSLPVRLQSWIKDRSHLARLLLDLTGYLGSRTGAVGRIDALWGEDFTEEDARRGVDLLTGIAARARELGAETLLLYTTGQAQVVQPDYRPPRTAGVVEEAARRAEIPWIDATAALRERPGRLGFYYAKDGHWTADGHRAIADILLEEIAARGWLAGRLKPATG